jgi:NAD-dependent DNA ligase
VIDKVHSLAKVNRMALIRSSFPTVVSDAQHSNIVQMIQKWIKENGSHNLPADLADLASRAQIVVSNLAVDVTMLQWQDKWEKAHPITPSAMYGAVHEILSGLCFVLTGVWPNQGGGHGLTLGKERVKQRIEKYGGIVTLSISGITNALVTGDCPGKKKIIEAHKRALKINTSIRSIVLFWGTLP